MKKDVSFHRIYSLFAFIAICLFIGWLGSVPTESSRTTWYAALQKPPLNPPDWVFAPVWTTLYIFIAFAGWRLWNSNTPDQKTLRILFVSQLVLNGVWSFLFFGLRAPWIALIDIILLWVCLLILVKKSFCADRLAGYLLIPYLLWVSFATYLNAAIWWLNK
jgi:tryptophan-rich sensory protein